MVDYAVVVVRADGLRLLERLWVADAVDALGARQRALDAAARLAGHLQPDEEAHVVAMTRVGN